MTKANPETFRPKKLPASSQRISGTNRPKGFWDQLIKMKCLLHAVFKRLVAAPLRTITSVIENGPYGHDLNRKLRIHNYYY